MYVAYVTPQVNTKMLIYDFVCFRLQKSKGKHSDQLSEPYGGRAQSRSLRDLFEKAILSGDIAIPTAGWWLLFLAFFTRESPQ